MATQTVYQLHTALDGYKPKIWRRILVSTTMKLSRLAYMLMTLYEMEGSHLFNLYSPDSNEYYALKNGNLVNDFDDEDTNNAASTPLKKVLLFVGQKIIFTYDFGDSWEIIITLEEIITDSDIPVKELPRVLKGKGYGIIDDCGGVPGLERIAEAFKRKEGQEYEQFCEWLGTNELDLKNFDIDSNESRPKKLHYRVGRLLRRRLRLHTAFPKKFTEVLITFNICG